MSAPSETAPPENDWVSATVAARSAASKAAPTTIRLAGGKAVFGRLAWSKAAAPPSAPGLEAEATVTLEVEVKGARDGTPAKLEVFSVGGDTLIGEVDGPLEVRGGRVVRAADGAAPEWRFLEAHHEKHAYLPPRAPLYYFRATLDGGRATAASPKAEKGALRLLYSVFCLGNPTGDLPGASAEMADVEALCGPSAHAATSVVRDAPLSVAAYGDRARNRYVVHHSGHGLVLCRTKGKIIPEYASVEDGCPQCGAADAETDVLGVALVNGEEHPGEAPIGVRVPATGGGAAAPAGGGRGIVLDEAPPAAPAPQAAAPAPDPAPAAPATPKWTRVTGTRKNLLAPEDLATLPNLPRALYFLNTCNMMRTKAFAKAAHARGTRFVVGWGFPVDDTLGRETAKGFYKLWLGTYKADPDKIPKVFAQIKMRVKAFGGGAYAQADWRISGS